MVPKAKMPKVSIAMPVYNGERYVAQAIESLLGQTFGDFEYVISDNASSDGTEDICRRYAAADARIRYVRRATNIGGPPNFNFVFSLSRGTYVKWATADDYSDTTFLDEAVAVLDEHPDVVLCFPRTRIIDADGNPIRDYDDNLDLPQESPRLRFRELYRRIGLCNAQLGLMRREAMARTGLLAAHLGSDIEFLGEMALLGKFRMLPETRFYRRFHQGASSWVRSDADRQLAFYSPGAKALPRFNLWRRHAYRFRMVWRSPIGLPDKIALSMELGTHMRYDRDELWRDLIAARRRRPSIGH